MIERLRKITEWRGIQTRRLGCDIKGRPFVARRGAPRNAIFIFAAAVLAIAVCPRNTAFCASPSTSDRPAAASAAADNSPGSSGATSDVESIVGSPLQTLDDSGVTGPIDDLFEDILDEGEVSWRDIVNGIFTGKGLDFGSLWKALGRSAARDLLSNAKILGRVILIGVVIACLEILSDTVAPGGSSKIAVWASHLSLIALAVMSFGDVLNLAKEAMEWIRTAFFAFIPALTSLSLVSGAPVTASVLHPLVFSMGTVVSVFMVDVAFPMIYTSTVLELAGNLSGGERAAGVAGIIRQVAYLAMGVLMACFVGAVVGQKAATGLADGMAYRTAKYLTSTFVPILGKPIGDTMDMFFVSAYSLRGVLGVVGAIALLGGVFSPFLQIVSCLLVWKIAAAALGPLCGPAVSKSLKSMGDGVMAIATAVLATSFCFVICLSLVAQAVKPF